MLSRPKTTAEEVKANEPSVALDTTKDLDIPYIVIDVESAKLDKFVSPDVRYKCRHPGCDLCFKRADQLHSHEFTHTQLKKFMCLYDDCDKAYTNNAHLKRHVKTAHLLTANNANCEKIPCKFGPPCTRQYKTKQKMLLHYQKNHIEHNDIKSFSFKCELCEETFRRKALYRMHMYSHTGNYPYNCEKCDKGFLNQNSLVRHRNAHKSYKCSECTEEFPKWSQLVAHRHGMHSSNEHKCSVCERIFSTKRMLKHHSVVHQQLEDRMVFQCKLAGCPRFFVHHKNLLAHQRSKHENRKFICGIGECGRELSSKQKLEAHMKTTHFNDGSRRQKEVKENRPRAPRKDKGIQKRSLASQICNIIAPIEIEKMIIGGHGSQIQLDYVFNEDNDVTEAVIILPNLNENIATEVIVQ